MRTLAGSSLALLLVLVSAAPVHGSEPTPADAGAIVSPEQVVGAPQGPALSGAELDRRTHDLAATMRCPVCQALSVADSPTGSALAMKEEIRDLLAAGYSESQVLEYFEKSYGEFILLAPKKKGLNWLVWIAPAVVLLIGVGVILGRSGKRKGSTEGEGESIIDPDLEAYAERVRQEVAE